MMNNLHLFLNFFTEKRKRKSTPKLQKFVYSSSNFHMNEQVNPCGMMTIADNLIPDERDSEK